MALPSPRPHAGSPALPPRSVRPALAALAAGAALALPAVAGAVPTGEPVPIPSTTGLATPWELAVAPDGRTFVVERDGGIRVLSATDALAPGAALSRATMDAAVDAVDDGATVRKLLGFALAPDFASSRLAYLYVGTTADPDGGGPANGKNGIWRLREQDGAFTVLGRVFDGIPSDGNHDGGRMVFGPDGGLYVTTGDIHQPARPQDPASLNGKILRFAVPASGPLTAPADNPFAGQGGTAPYVWSLGHRHPQGLAFDAAGRLWETEHGPTGEQHGAQYPGGNNQTGRDELNVITKGGNYGWPLVSGPMTGAGLTPPVAVAGSAPAWAPGDVAVGADGSLYAPFLAGQQLHRFDVRTGAVFAEGTHFASLGRLRVAVPRGGELLVAADGDGGLFRVALSGRTPGGSDAADPLAVPTGPPALPGTGPGTGTPPPAADGAAAAAAAARARTRALTLRLARELRRLGRRRLEAGRTVSVRIAGPSAGRTTIELRLRSSKGTLLARVRPRTSSAAAQRYRVRLGPVGRRRLRAASTRRLVVRVVHRPTTGAVGTSATRVTVARRR